MHEPLLAISPLDGRYHTKTQALSGYFSEFALIKYRIQAELAWFKSLAANPDIPEVPTLSDSQLKRIDRIDANFSPTEAKAVKAIEAETNHDVKAVEYYLKQQFTQANIGPTEFIHFACTSEDINNVAYALMLKACRDEHLLPQIDALYQQLTTLAKTHADVALLARTHGQAASPTTLGKEIANTAARLNAQRQLLRQVKIQAKMNGAVGNYNAHHCAYPNINWPAHCEQVIKALGLHHNPFTTQIEPHDYIAEFSHACIRINTILLDFSRDVWAYIALGYFQLALIENEVGSSTMPHKVNPIDFENAEGNLGIANALWQFFAEKLPISRWQRDLSDSTVLRNLGVALGHNSIALQSLQRGIGKLAINPQRINEDLEQHWDVLAEALQTVMRRYNIEQAYEKVKTLTRGKSIDRDTLHAFINSLELPETVKKELLQLSPASYTGYAAKLVEKLEL
jgi:adenylosuccinate lyase